MSDQTIDQLRTSLKQINECMEKLAKAVNELEMIAYRYHRLSYEINQIDVAAFAVRQKFEQVRDACRRASE
jgi:hypothetical protein